MLAFKNVNAPSGGMNFMFLASLSYESMQERKIF